MEIDNLKVKTYIEDEYRFAYAKARKELGHNLVIIEKKEIKVGGVFGLFGKKRIRVTFGVELTTTDKKVKEDFVAENNNEFIKALRDVAVKHISDSDKPKVEKEVDTFKPLASELFNIKTDKIETGIYNSLNKEPKKSFEEIQKELKLKPQEKIIEISIPKKIFEDDPIESLKKELERELKASERLKRENIKKDEFDFVDFLRDHDFEKDLAKEIDLYFEENSYDKKDCKKGLKAFFKSCIKVKKENEQKKFIMLIGPTGVGKTTTCAKIVANNWRNEKNVGFITADTYRLEAVSQLKAYANIMRVPIEVVNKPEDLTKTIEKFRDKDLVLMDTAGRSPKNKEQMEELKSYVSSKGDDMETILVLSATSKISVLHENIEKFEQIGFDSIIITKIDETSSLNSLLSIFKKYPYPFYYITNGQSVPDDIEICTEAMLTDMFMKGIK